MIPKIIHYCWFGGKEIPDEYKAYIDEWEALNPGWEIKRWDESNIPSDLIYVQNALTHEKWANLSNFVRYYTLLYSGGIYLDTDVKLIKPLDELLGNECFMGFEEGSENDSNFWVNNAVAGAVPAHPFIDQCYRYLLDTFDGLEDANLSGPQLTTHLLKEICGLQSYGLQTINGVTLYPTSWFYPIHYNEVYKLGDIWNNIDQTTVAVHMWSRSWLTPKQLLDLYDDLQFKYQHSIGQIEQYKLLLQNVKSVTDDFAIDAHNSPTQLARKDEIERLLVAQSDIEKKLDAILTASDNSAKELLARLQNKEAELNQQITSLVSNEALLLQLIQQKDNQLQENEASLKKINSGLQEYRQAGEREKEEKEKLAALLEANNKELGGLTAKTALLEREKNDLNTTIDLKNVELNAKNDELDSQKKRIEELQQLLNSFSIYKESQVKNNDELIQFLQNKIDDYKKQLTWYQATYEKRNILGVVKDRLLKSLIK